MAGMCQDRTIQTLPCPTSFPLLLSTRLIFIPLIHSHGGVRNDRRYCSCFCGMRLQCGLRAFPAPVSFWYWPSPQLQQISGQLSSHGIETASSIFYFRSLADDTTCELGTNSSTARDSTRQYMDHHPFVGSVTNQHSQEPHHHQHPSRV